jgi:hypothetical protein
VSSEYAIQWSGTFSANLFFDFGDGNVLRALVYADDGLTAMLRSQETGVYESVGDWNGNGIAILFLCQPSSL